MPERQLRIGVVAPASRIAPDLAQRAQALAGEAELVFHPQCFLSDGHFAGNDDTRAQAFLEIANDPGFDALWWARGGYGANRIAGQVIASLNDDARNKAYLGYSDAGFMLAGLYKAGFGRLAHGPVVADLRREAGEAAFTRGLRFLAGRVAKGDIEPSPNDGRPRAAFNLTVLSHLIGTALEPDLAGHVLLLEDVSEHLYRIDRAFFQITSHPPFRALAGIRLGRFSDILENDPAFAQGEEDIARHWCALSDIPYLGRADIGHDIDNKVVPFGHWPR